jgi:hypothetical protein
MRIAKAGALVMALSTVSAAEGQTLPTFERGARLWVRTSDGQEHDGRVSSASGTQLVLETSEGLQSITAAEVDRVEGVDPLGNGIRNGGIAGAVAFAAFGFYLSQALCEIPDGCLGNDLGAIALMAGIGGGIGMAAGAGIDYAIKGRRLLYPLPSTSMSLELRPWLLPGAAGARVTLAWTR